MNDTCVFLITTSDCMLNLPKLDPSPATQETHPLLTTPYSSGRAVNHEEGEEHEAIVAPSRKKKRTLPPESLKTGYTSTPTNSYARR